MNYVAHLFLAKPNDAHRIGSLLADFTVGTLASLGTKYNSEVVAGIAHHRAVDKFTDCHAHVAKAVDSLAHRFGLYSGIIVDVVYDHFLLKHWHRFSDVPIEQFFDSVYLSLSQVDETYPEKFIQVVDGIIERRWLSSYIDLESVCYALKRIGMRFSRPTPLFDTRDGITESYGVLDESFRTFFPELTEYSKTIIGS